MLKEYDDLKDDLKFRKKAENKNSSVSKTKKENQCFYRNMQCLIVKN